MWIKMKTLKLFLFVLLLTSAHQAQNQVPKNIIFMIGDGMGIGQVSLSVLDDPGSAFFRFRSIGLVETCAADNLITDSAASGTALSSGYRTKNRYIGVDSSGISYANLFEVAKRHNKKTGIVVTCAVTHATPAAFYAHIDSRSREFEIAEQFLNSGMDFAAGAGTEFFLPPDSGGKRSDGRNLIEELKQKGYSYIDNLTDLIEMPRDKKIAESSVLVLLDSLALPQAERRNYRLSELVKLARNHLKGTADGFVLMVEGSQIDWAGHANNSEYLNAEMADFNEAIKAALEFAETDRETLVLVTADHETGGASVIGEDKEKGNLKSGFVYGNHTANLVGIFASGPGESDFSGVFKNSLIGRKLIEYLEPDHFSK